MCLGKQVVGKLFDEGQGDQSDHRLERALAQKFGGVALPA
jgi:hypothetical protein